jgi:hypothetical protein
MDGKSHPFNNPSIDEMIVTRIDRNTMLVVAKRAGQEAFTQRYVVSKDGKSQTLTYIQKEGGGRRALHNVSV